MDVEGQDSVGDIYRGERRSGNFHSVTTHSISSTSGSSSSSSVSSRSRGRLETIATAVEAAISRWAKTFGGSSSSSSSDSSSSIVTVSRSRSNRHRRRRAGSVASLRSQQSERDIAARIKAREESRQVPRQFTLYLPPDLSNRPDHDPSQRVLLTSSLSLVTERLETALSKSTKPRKKHGKSVHRSGTSTPLLQRPNCSHHHHMNPEQLLSSLQKSYSPRNLSDKRKSRATTKVSFLTHEGSTKGAAGLTPRVSKTWWLDVSSPTWEDMRTLGKLFHLHPLTLEDILQQDPREKLELFPKLGYYFIVFRGIESRAVREKFWRRQNRDEDDQGEGQPNGGPVGEANIYLVVFKEGICSFHFTDVSEHTDRVRNRLCLLEQIANMSSDWIAHGILDSIVDSFFPFLEEVEREVVHIEALVFSDDRPKDKPPLKAESINALEPEEPIPEKAGFSEKCNSRKSTASASPLEKPEKPDSMRTRFVHPRWTLPLIWRRLRKRLVNIVPQNQADPPQSATFATLRRMARVRRLVTSLTRLLAAKSEVLTQIRKRLLSPSDSGLGNRTKKSAEHEVAIYMGDVQDHIFSLLHSLAHYERMLSQSHPAYLFQLRHKVAHAKAGSQTAALILTGVSIGVVMVQTLIGVFSINVDLPHNVRQPGHPYTVFMIVIALAVLIIVGYLYQLRKWWYQAGRSRVSPGI